MSQSKRFSHSFKPTVKLKPGQECRLKNHWSGVCRELIGFIELLAANDPERFVFASAPALAKRCKKFSDKSTYGLRAVEYALEEFRRRDVISKRLVRYRDGIQRKGFVVANHGGLAACQDGRCFWDGFLPESAGSCAGSSAGHCAGHCAGSSAVCVSGQENDS